MIGATVWNHLQDQVKVAVWDDDGEKAIVFTNATDLPKVINKYKPSEIWQDGNEVEFCFTPNCHELVCKSDPCPLCSGCLQEYQQEQLDYQGMRNQLRYAGMIG